MTLAHRYASLPSERAAEGAEGLAGLVEGGSDGIAANRVDWIGGSIS